MDCTAARNDCSGCTEKVVCYCLQVTEEALLVAVETLGLRTLKEVRQATGAGDGCTACHQRIRQSLEAQVQSSSSAEPICSVR
jgi:bacterioferritin-associated ferredoxin